MIRLLIIGAMGLAAGVLLLFTQKAQASIAPDDASPDSGENGLPSFSWRGIVYGSSNVSAFLAFIRAVEPARSDPYHSLVGGGFFSDFSDHPAALGWPGVRINGVKTTAAGAYQITYSTWNAYKDAAGVSDFSPDSQDTFAVYLLHVRGAYEDVKAGNFFQAMNKCRNEWEAFDKILRDQYFVSASQAQDIFISNGGNVA